MHMRMYFRGTEANKVIELNKEDKLMHYSFVILHYQNATVTRQCIKYIKELSYSEPVSIVVVDNASPNQSGKELKKEYDSSDDIHVLLLEKNIGFASGNNKGYLYAKHCLKSDVILVINSDLFISDVDFLNKLGDVIKRNPQDYVLAVDIVSAYGGHQNPYRLQPISTQKQIQIIARKRVGQLIYSIPGLNAWIINKKPRTSTVKNVIKEERECFDIVPHGACVIYTYRWLEKEEFAFLEGTFLFVEEEILFDYCKYKGYRIHYVPSLEVHHLEDASQNADSTTAVIKKKNQIKHEINSRKLLIQLRRKYKE